MSFLRKISSSDRLLMKTRFLTISAYYSRDNKSKAFADRNIRDQSRDGGPNWEIFHPKRNRFYLPNSVGPAWQNYRSTLSLLHLENFIDFDSKKSDKLQYSSKRCPALIRNDLREIFPASSMNRRSNEFSVITLSYQRDAEVENSAKNFVLAAREICHRLHEDYHWADFMNPFSGKPFFYQNVNQKLYKIDKRFRGLGIKYEDRNNCLVITSDVDTTFSGSIFTDATSDQDELKYIIRYCNFHNVYDDDDDDDDGDELYDDSDDEPRV